MGKQQIESSEESEENTSEQYKNLKKKATQNFKKYNVVDIEDMNRKSKSVGASTSGEQKVRLSTEEVTEERGFNLLRSVFWDPDAAGIYHKAFPSLSDAQSDKLKKKET